MKKNQFTIRLMTLILAALMIGLMMGGCRAELPSLPETTAAPTENAEHIAAYKQYVQSVLDANYHADYADYMEITGASESQASRINQAHAVNLAGQLAELYDIQLEKLPAEIGDRLIELSKEVYKQSEYSVLEVEMTEKNVYVTIAVQPLDFLDDTADAVSDYTADFNDRAKAGEFEHMTESQYENEYAEGLLEVLEEETDEIGHADQVTYRIKIMQDSETGVNYISDDDLDEINHLILAD